MKKQTEKIDPKTIEIPLHFHNYKLLKDKKFLLKGSAIYFVKGPNRTGKTSFLNALAAMQLAQEPTPEPVTRGAREGFNEFVIPGADGGMYTIRHTFDNKVNKFLAIDQEGNKISQVTKIREIFNYTHFTVDQFFSWSNSAEGRRKQRDIILELLPTDDQDKFNYLDDRESLLYTQRTDKARDKDYLEKQLPASKLSQDEEFLLKENKNKDDEIKKLNTDLLNAVSASKELESVKTQITNNTIEIEELQKKLTFLQEKNLGLFKQESNFMSIYLKILGTNTLDDFKIKINQAVISNKVIDELRFKSKTYNELAYKVQTVKNEWEKMDVELKDIRIQKNQIISDANLPVKDISFIDGYLNIDGFQFDEKQVCESDGVLLIAKIMSKINPAPIQLVGDASILDLSRLEELNKIAEEEGKIMFVDEVSRDINDLQVVGYEEIKGKIEKKNGKVNEQEELDDEDREILETFDNDATEADEIKRQAKLQATNPDVILDNADDDDEPEEQEPTNNLLF
jgi:hypothetical protein